MKMKLHLLILAGLVASSLACQAQNAVAAAAVPAVPATPAAPVSTNVANEVSPLIAFEDVPLLDAVKSLARQSGLNFVYDLRVTTMSNQPNVTLRLENVTPNDALTAVLDTYNLAVVQDFKTKISRVTIKDPKAEDPLVSRVIQLKYSQPTNLVTVLKATLSPRSQVLADMRTSQLIVVSTEKEFPELEKLIVKLDAATKQVLIEAQLWETSKNPRSVKGIDWSRTLEAQSISYGNGRTTAATTTTTPGTPVTTTTPGGRPITTTPSSTTKTVMETLAGNGGFTANSAMGLHPSTAFLNADGLNVVLSFLNRDNDTEIVATPRAVTMDNQLATLSVTRAFPVFKITPGSANSPAGADISYTNVGTMLQVTPRIAANSNISLTVIPEVSDIFSKDSQVINGFENTANIYSIRRIETHVMIPSGSTLVMGGLINDRAAKGYSKVPILGDAPFGIGLLFRKDSKSRDKSNLIIFVTPTIVDDGDFQAAQTTDFMKTKSVIRPDFQESDWDAGKPHDWSKPAKKAEASSSAPSDTLKSGEPVQPVKPATPKSGQNN